MLTAFTKVSLVQLQILAPIYELSAALEITPPNEISGKCPQARVGQRRVIKPCMVH